MPQLPFRTNQLVPTPAAAGPSRAGVSLPPPQQPTSFAGAITAPQNATENLARAISNLSAAAVETGTRIANVERSNTLSDAAAENRERMNALMRNFAEKPAEWEPAAVAARIEREFNQVREDLGAKYGDAAYISQEDIDRAIAPEMIDTRDRMLRANLVRVKDKSLATLSREMDAGRIRAVKNPETIRGTLGEHRKRLLELERSGFIDGVQAAELNQSYTAELTTFLHKAQALSEPGLLLRQLDEGQLAVTPQQAESLRTLARSQSDRVKSAAYIQLSYADPDEAIKGLRSDTFFDPMGKETLLARLIARRDSKENERLDGLAIAQHIAAFNEYRELRTSDQLAGFIAKLNAKENGVHAAYPDMTESQRLSMLSTAHGTSLSLAAHEARGREEEYAALVDQASRTGDTGTAIALLSRASAEDLSPGTRASLYRRVEADERERINRAEIAAAKRERKAQREARQAISDRWAAGFSGRDLDGLITDLRADLAEPGSVWADVDPVVRSEFLTSALRQKHAWAQEDLQRLAEGQRGGIEQGITAGLRRGSMADIKQKLNAKDKETGEYRNFSDVTERIRQNYLQYIENWERTRRDAAQSEAKRAAMKRIDDYLDFIPEIGQGEARRQTGVDLATLHKGGLLTDDELDRFRDVERAADRFHGAMAKIPTANIREMTRMAQDLHPASTQMRRELEGVVPAGAEGGWDTGPPREVGRQLVLYNRMMEKIRKRTKEIAEDPGAYAYKAVAGDFPTASPGRAAWYMNTPPADQAAYFDRAMNAQGEAGLSPALMKPLPEGAAITLAKELNDAPGAARAELVTRITDATGYGPQIMAQLNALTGEGKVDYANLILPHVAFGFRDELAGIIDRSLQDYQGRHDDAQTRGDVKKQSTTEYNETFGASMVYVTSDIQEAFADLHEKVTHDQVLKGLSPGDAALKATELLFGASVFASGASGGSVGRVSTLRIPRAELNGGRVAADYVGVLNDYTESLTGDMLLLGQGDMAPINLNALKDSYMWKSTGDNERVRLYFSSPDAYGFAYPVADAEGRPVEFAWHEITAKVNEQREEREQIDVLRERRVRDNPMGYFLRPQYERPEGQ